MTGQTVRHFLRDDDLTPAEQAQIIDRAIAMKQDRFGVRPFEGPQAVAIIFDKPTLRTQVSFMAGIAELGGFPFVVDGNLAQIGVRQSIADSAKAVSYTHLDVYKRQEFRRRETSSVVTARALRLLAFRNT